MWVSTGKGWCMVVGWHFRVRPSCWTSSWNVGWVIQNESSQMMTWVIPGAQDDVVPPAPAGRVGPEAVGLKHNEPVDGGCSSIHVGITGVTARVWEVTQGLVANGLGAVGHRKSHGPRHRTMWQGESDEVEALQAKAVVSVSVECS